MSLYGFLKEAAGLGDQPVAAPVMAQITIISSGEPVKQPSGSPSPQSPG